MSEYIKYDQLEKKLKTEATDARFDARDADESAVVEKKAALARKRTFEDALEMLRQAKA